MKNNKLFWVYAFIFLISASFVVAVAPSSSDTVAYWKLEDLTDEVSTNDFSTYGSPTLTSVVLDNGYDLSGSNEGLTVAYNPYEGISTTTTCLWFNGDDVTGGSTTWNTGVNHYLFTLGNTYYGAQFNSESKLIFRAYDGAVHDITSNTVFSSLTDYFVCFVLDGTYQQIYVNGVIDTNTSNSASVSGSTGSSLYFGSKDDEISGEYDGRVDEISIYDVALSPSEISYLYNSGSPTSNQQYPFSGASPAFSVTAKDVWSDATINNFWAFIDGTNYTTTNGTINTDLFQNDTNTYTLQVGATDYFPITYYSIAVDTNYEATLHQSEISFNSYEAITNNSISNCNYTIDGVQETTFFLNAGDHTVLVECSGYYAKNYSFTVAALDSLTENVTGLYNSRVTFNLKDVLTGSLLGVDSYVIIENSTYGFSQSFSSVDGIILANLSQLDYSLTYYADGYATGYDNISVNSSNQEFNFSLYSNNSVWVYAFDVDTGVVLTNFNVEIYDANNSYLANDTLGVAYLNDIPAGVYTVAVSRSGYTTNTYSLTMTGGSHQRVNAYLATDTSVTKTIFTTVDLISGGVIENVTISQYKTVGGNWTLISTKETDLTGRSQFSYTSGIDYRFDFVANGYESRIVYLEPLFDTYTVRLTPNIQSIPDSNVGDWIYTISNYGLFYNDQVNNFSVTIASGIGSLEYYYLNVTIPDGTVVDNNCSNSYGCTDSYSLNITGSTFEDVVLVEYWVKESGRQEHYFRNVYHIQNVYNSSTLESWKSVIDSDIDSLSKAFIAMIICLIIVGFVSVGSILVGVSPIIASGIVLALLVEVFGYVGFIPSLAGHLVALGCLMIVIFGRGEI